MERRKLTKEDIDKVRDIDGFPIGTDEDIIALSDAPYYTACPNPFIEDFIKEYGTPYDEATDVYHCEPFAADVSEGKNDPIYVVHSYHTKVPHKAIMKYILHYTKPGDIVFDGFCGTGMTGIAAQACGLTDLQLLFADLSNNNWGQRKSIISDLSPAATSISHGYNMHYDMVQFSRKIQRTINACREECGWMYKTLHSSNNGSEITCDKHYGDINYIVWSDVFICPNCGHEFVYWDEAIDKTEKKLKDQYACPVCGAINTKNSCQHAKDTRFSEITNNVEICSKQVPVLIIYTFNGKRYKKKPDNEDINLIKKIENLSIPYWYPKDFTPKGTNTDQPKISHGIERVDQFYWKRSLYLLAKIRNLLTNNELLVFTGILYRASKMNRIHIKNFFHGGGGWNAGYLKGTLYVPSIPIETSVIDMLEDRFKTIQRALTNFNTNDATCISTQSLTDLKQMPSNSIDYIFIDPPFGNNINYSELNFLWEAWLKVKTNILTEAIVNETQKKGLGEYQYLMARAFSECYRVLKPNRWITIEFHNSKNAVWSSIQESILKAGFIIADVRTLNKKQGSFKQVTTSSAVKQDLVISAYKPKEKFTKNMILTAGTEDTAWHFVSQHLSNLPVAVIKNGSIEIISERQAYLLFDRMVAYHIVQGMPVPLDATDFYKGLDAKFLKRDGMYFLPNQVNEYDTARIENDIEPVQFSMFVTNEKTAIAWLYQQLSDENGGPQTYAEIQPKFMQEVKTVDRYEAMPELAVLLEESFIQDTNGRWYVPDITKEGDIAKLREKKLWKEFEGYMNSKGKLKLFRSEAIRVGFSRLWKDKNYQAIVSVAERLPEQTIQEDPNLLMYYDISLSRV